MKVGIAVRCTVCGMTKAPIGRSCPDALANSRCNSFDCEGYYTEPLPGSLWPGETEEEFGFPVGSNATEDRSDEDPSV